MLRVLFENSLSDKFDNEETKESFEKNFREEVKYNIILRGEYDKRKKQRKKKRQP